MNKNESSQSGQGCQRLVTFCDLFSGGGFQSSTCSAWLQHEESIEHREPISNLVLRLPGEKINMVSWPPYTLWFMYQAKKIQILNCKMEFEVPLKAEEGTVKGSQETCDPVFFFSLFLLCLINVRACTGVVGRSETNVTGWIRNLSGGKTNRQKMSGMCCDLWT